MIIVSLNRWHFGREVLDVFLNLLLHDFILKLVLSLISLVSVEQCHSFGHLIISFRFAFLHTLEHLVYCPIEGDFPEHRLVGRQFIPLLFRQFL